MMKSFKHSLFLWFLLFGMWLLLNISLAPVIVTTGLILATFLTLLMGRDGSLLADIRWTPKSIIAMIGYIFMFAWEIVKANWDVAKRVVTPTVNINPGVVKIKTKLKSNLGRLVLANSITLTPGTLTIDVIDDTLYIHWIDVSTQDVQKASEEIAAVFEKYLEVICG